MGNPKPRVLMVAAEVGPFAKVGGLGDVMGALPIALSKQKTDVRLILPLYKSIDRKKYRIRKVAGLDPIEIAVGDESFSVRFFRSNLPNTKVQVFFIECEALFGRNGIYAENNLNNTYSDNPTRFIFFSKAVIEFLKTGVFSPNIIHLNDNQSALIAPMLRTIDQDDDLSELKILLTIHNLEYQGQCEPTYIHKAGLDPAHSYPGGPFEFYGQFSFLKAGIVYADKLNTVSETYAKETQTSSEAGFGLEGVLRARGASYCGILNGADYDTWDPRIDKHISKPYSQRAIDLKIVNKQDLLAYCGHESQSTSIPIIGLISRLVYQKGIDLVLTALPEILSHDVHVVVLGTGDMVYQGQLREMQNKYPQKLSVFLEFSEKLAHMIEAGSDMFLMASRYEPCGLNQMYSLRYGSIPIVRETGGLADTVRNYDPVDRTGWGFTFKEFSADALVNAVSRALSVYQDSEAWRIIVKRAMSLDYSWEKSALQYRRLYTEMLGSDGRSG